MTKPAGGNMSDPLYAFPTTCGQALRALARYPSRVAFDL
jgi:fatty-acyl-CoA synthase